MSVTLHHPLRVQAAVYQLECAADRPYVYLSSADGQRIAELFVPGSVHTLRAFDDTTRLGIWQARQGAGEVVFELGAQSSVWRKKTYRFRCRPERLRFEVEIEGAGVLGDVHYFGGYSSATVRWGSGFFWSGGRFKGGLNPEPTVSECYRFAPGESSLIDMSGVPIVGKGGWFFTPPPFCFALEHAAGWFGLGVEAAPGCNRFGEFHYRAQREAFYLTLPFEGYTEVQGRYQLPAIGFDFARSAYEALERHADALRAQELAPPGSGHEAADWWRTPIFCGWGAQGALAAPEKGHAPDYARQEYYEDFIKLLEDRGVAPGIIVLDDKWQASYGENRVDREKWPDLEGFIRRQHEAGRKVLLWLKAWDPEGLPFEECVTNTAGLRVAVDPTQPAFEARFREAIRTMLSLQGYDADGFKLDFTARIPNGPGLKLHGHEWGLELMKRYLDILYRESKRVKPDALVMTHTPHPYLSDTLDMIRLNDVNTSADIVQSAQHRARIAAIACPEAVIDTDNWPMRDLAMWRAYLRAQPELGVPSLYYVSHIDASGEALEAEDYQLIRDTWNRFERKSHA